MPSMLAAAAVAVLVLALPAPDAPDRLGNLGAAVPPSVSAAADATPPTVAPDTGRRIAAGAAPPTVAPISQGSAGPSVPSARYRARGASGRQQAAGAPLLGVNVDLVGAPPDEIARTADRLGAAGIDAVRVPVRWAAVEPSPGVFRWDEVDEVVEAFDRAGVSILLTLMSSPDWSRHDPTPEPHLFLCADENAIADSYAGAAPPTEPSTLAAFASAVVGRYAGRLWALEVWSEPNILPNWRRTGPDPEDYARLLSATAEAVRIADADVLVASAALAPTTDIGVCYLSDIVYLDRLARTGALESVDAVGIEPFGLRQRPSQGGAETLGFRRAEALHAVLVRHGVDKTMWAMAWGWVGLPPEWAGTPSPWGMHEPEIAASNLELAYDGARNDWPWMGSMFVWHDRPATDSADPAVGFAMVRPDGRTTLLWDSVVALAAGKGRYAGASLADPAEINDARVRKVRLAALVAVAVALLTAGLAVRRWLAPGVKSVVGAVGRRPMPRLVAGYALLVLLCALVPHPLTLIALPVLVVIAAAAPEIAIAAVAVAAPLNHAVQLHAGATPVWPVELLVAVALAGQLLALYAWPMGLRALVGSAAATVRSRARALDLLVIGLVVWAAVSPMWSEHTAPALRELRTVIVEPAILYALVRLARDRRRAAQHAVDGLVLGAVVAATWALTGVALHIAGNSGMAVAAEGVIRATGPYASPNNLALFLGRLLPVLVAFAVWGDPVRRRWYAAATPIVALALLLTFSRGALVVGVPATIAYLATVGLVLEGNAQRRRIGLATVGAVASLAVLVLPFARTERVRSTFGVTPGSTTYLRVRLWQSAVDMVRDHPLLGVGLDNFLYLFRDRYVARDAAQERFLSHPHNAVLDWWTRLGLPGVLLFAGLIVGNVRAGARAVKGVPSHRALAVAGLGMQLYALAHGMVDNVFFLVDLAVVWWIAQAAVLALAEPLGPREQPT